MASCCRSSVKDIPKRRVSATNPWGAGHSWVKKRFIDPAPRLTPITESIENHITGEQIDFTRVTINCDLKDNKFLIENDPSYIAMLNSITNEAKRKAWIEGDWSIQVGAFFGDCWSNDNIIKPFKIPAHWTKIQSYDFGYAKPFSFGWFAVSDGTIDGIPTGALIRYREWYGCVPNEPDTGIRINVDEQAKKVKRLESGERIDIRVGDPSIWDASRGISVGEQFMRCGITMTKGDNKRQSGWEYMRKLLKGEEVAENEYKPMLYIFDNCIDTIRTIPVLLHDNRKPEDLDTTQEDHIADEMRYGLMSRFQVTTKQESNNTSAFAKIRDANTRRARFE